MPRAFRSLVPVVALLAGCTMPAPLAGPGTGNWVLDRQAEAPMAVVPVAAGAIAPPLPETPTAPADPAFAAIAESLALPLPAAEPVRRSGGGGSSRAAAATSRLTVDLRGFLGGLAPLRARRLLATVDDVEKLVVTVYQPGQPERVITVTKAQIAAGVAEVTFEELALGNAIVFAVAYDATETPIGSAAQVVVVTASGAAMADLPLQLVPTGGSGGGVGGTLITRAALLDGPLLDPPTGTVLTEARTFLGLAILDVEPMADGEVAVGMTAPPGSPINNGLSGRVISFYQHIAADGTYRGYVSVASRLRMAAGVTHLAPRMRGDGRGGVFFTTAGRHVPDPGLIDPATKLTGRNLLTLGQALPYTANVAVAGPSGDLFYLPAGEEGGPIHRMTAAGVETTTTMTAGRALAPDPAGNLWTDAGEAVARYGPDGTLLGTFPIPGTVAYIWAAPDGSAWVGHGEAGQPLPTYIGPLGAVGAMPRLSHVAADGTVLATVALPCRDVAVDQAGNAWVAGPVLTKLSPAGATMGSWAVDAQSVAVATDGMVWVGGTKGLVRRLQP